MIPPVRALADPGIKIKDEIDPNLLYDKEGVVGMANSGANTNGSQFFITLAAQPNLDGRYHLCPGGFRHGCGEIHHPAGSLCSNGTTGTGQDPERHNY